MKRPTLAACVFAVVVAMAGCSSAGTGTAPTTTESPPTTPPVNATVDYETVVFDGGFTGQPIIEGGLTHPDDTRNETYDATLLTDGNATARFNWNALPADSRTLVNGTDFDTASILVVQAFPKSSVPDYRVESLTRSGDTLDVALNDSSAFGTDDITIETVLVRVSHDGTPPTNAHVTTQDGASFDADSALSRTDSLRPSRSNGFDIAPGVSR